MNFFHTPISTSTPHTYISAGPFLPTKSPLSTIFNTQFTKGIKVESGKMLSWPAPPLEWIGHKSDVNSICYSPNGCYIVSGSEDNAIRIWDAETGDAVGKPLEGHTGNVLSVAYSPDGRHVISGSSDKTLRIWNAETGSAVGKPLEGHTDWVQSVAYSPDGHHIISGSFDKTIRIWNAETGSAVGKPLGGHTGLVWSVAYSPDGRHIISGSSDETIRIWNAETGSSVGKPLEGQTDYVQSVVCSPNSRHIISRPNHRALHVSDSFSSISTQSTSAIKAERPDPNGWVRGPGGSLLYWVPPDCRAGLHSPALLTIPLTSPVRSVSLQFDEFVFGTSWIQISNIAQR